jgi:hypothetical protein
VPADIFGTSLLTLVAAVFGLVGLAFLAASLVALRNARPWHFAIETLVGLLLLSTGLLSGAVGAGLQGYRGLTREETAARVMVQPTGTQRFTATVSVPGREAVVFDLAGDQFYVDAHVLKWKPLANILGLHTVYELDRVAGRYQDLENERSAERTVYSLAPVRGVDLVTLRRRYVFLEPLLDVEYGSGAFVQVTGPASFDVRVSTTGLLIRNVAP